MEQDGKVLDALQTCRRDARAAKRFFRKLLKGRGAAWQLVTDKLGGYAAAPRDLGLTANHRTGGYEHNPVEVTHRRNGERERPIRRFKVAEQAQRFLAVHAAIGNAFPVARHRLKAIRRRLGLRQALNTWDLAAGASQEVQYRHRSSDHNRLCPSI